MSERNATMAAMIVAKVAERDLGFEIRVLTRIEQRRFIRSLAVNLVAAAAAALLLALVAPQLDLLRILGGRLMGDLSRSLSMLTDEYLLMAPLLLAGFVAWYSRPSAQI